MSDNIAKYEEQRRMQSLIEKSQEAERHRVMRWVTVMLKRVDDAVESGQPIVITDILKRADAAVASGDRGDG
jgi:hypothetical protein